VETIAIDTNIFIYALEDKGRLGDSARGIFRLIKREKPNVFTSVITIEEVLVGVYKEGLEEEIVSYLEFISGGGLITIVEVSKQVAMLSARIRAHYKIQTPDAIQLATGILSGASQFITADRRLPKKVDDITIKVIK
jgi:predicted nucleic acid-binding protein